MIHLISLMMSFYNRSYIKITNSKTKHAAMTEVKKAGRKASNKAEEKTR